MPRVVHGQRAAFAGVTFADQRLAGPRTVAGEQHQIFGHAQVGRGEQRTVGGDGQRSLAGVDLAGIDARGRPIAARVGCVPQVAGVGFAVADVRLAVGVERQRAVLAVVNDRIDRRHHPRTRDVGDVFEVVTQVGHVYFAGAVHEDRRIFLGFPAFLVDRRFLPFARGVGRVPEVVGRAAEADVRKAVLVDGQFGIAVVVEIVDQLDHPFACGVGGVAQFVEQLVVAVGEVHMVVAVHRDRRPGARFRIAVDRFDRPAFVVLVRVVENRRQQPLDVFVGHVRLVGAVHRHGREQAEVGARVHRFGRPRTAGVGHVFDLE